MYVSKFYIFEIRRTWAVEIFLQILTYSTSSSLYFTFKIVVLFLQTPVTASWTLRFCQYHRWRHNCIDVTHATSNMTSRRHTCQFSRQFDVVKVSKLQIFYSYPQKNVTRYLTKWRHKPCMHCLNKNYQNIKINIVIGNFFVKSRSSKWYIVCQNLMRNK